MNLLEKFEAVEIGRDTRISETDKRFCETQKEAYDYARAALNEMYELTLKHANKQTAIFENAGFDRTQYFDVEGDKMRKSLHGNHLMFISSLVKYFSRKYKVTLEVSCIENALVPKCDGRRYDAEAITAYSKQMDELELTYEQVLDAIFSQLDGFSFADKAVNELKEKCHAAGWHKYHGFKQYELKKALISFKYGCSWDSFWSTPRIELRDEIVNAIRGLSYFETGTLDFIHPEFRDLFDYRLESPEFTFNCTKVKSIKCFKNGRLDIRFTNEEYAREFAEEYLGTEA